MDWDDLPCVFCVCFAIVCICVTILLLNTIGDKEYLKVVSETVRDTVSLVSQLEDENDMQTLMRELERTKAALKKYAKTENTKSKVPEFEENEAGEVIWNPGDEALSKGTLALTKMPGEDDRYYYTDYPDDPLQSPDTIYETYGFRPDATRHPDDQLSQVYNTPVSHVLRRRYDGTGRTKIDVDGNEFYETRQGDWKPYDNKLKRNVSGNRKERYLKYYQGNHGKVVNGYYIVPNAGYMTRVKGDSKNPEIQVLNTAGSWVSPDGYLKDPKYNIDQVKWEYNQHQNRAKSVFKPGLDDSGTFTFAPGYGTLATKDKAYRDTENPAMMWQRTQATPQDTPMYYPVLDNNMLGQGSALDDMPELKNAIEAGYAEAVAKAKAEAEAQAEAQSQKE